MPEIKPLGDRVIVEIISQNDAEREELEARLKKSGLAIPSVKDDPTKASGPPVLGIVYAMGPEAVEKFGDNITIGDKVVYSEKQPHGFMWDNKRLLALNADQIVARLERA